MTNPTNSVCPECNSEVLPTQYCMMGHWCGEPVVPTLTAHDVPAAKLRERLAALEIDNRWLRDRWDEATQSLDKATDERDTARADCKLHMESFLTVANAMGMPEAHPQKIANEIAALRAEAADLWARLEYSRAMSKLWKGWCKAYRTQYNVWHDSAIELEAQLAERHTLADGYAGLLAEKGEESQAVKNILALKNEHCLTWRDKPDSFWFFGLLEEVGELGSALIGEHKDSPEWELTQISAIAMNWLEKRNAQRPEAEGRES